ncbi:hypothetical protein KY285_007854 [Solanum tuberosum]|nr:hypothetical protein KY285_007854 [Solanum tuberosum]
MDVRQDLRYGADWPRQLNRQFSRSNNSQVRTSVKTLAIEPICPNGQNGPFSRSNKPQSG